MVHIDASRFETAMGRGPTVLLGLLREARPQVQLMFQIRLLSGALLVYQGRGVDPVRLVAVCLTWYCVMTFIYVLNGATDVLADRFNGSTRPVAAGALGLAQARWGAAGFAAAAMLGGLALGRSMTGAVLVALALGVSYSVPPLALKNRGIGAGAVGGLGGLVTYYVGYDLGAGRPNPALVIFAAAMASWMCLVGAQVKDLSDIPGDRAAGRRTLAGRLPDPVLRRGIAVLALGFGASLPVLAYRYAPVLIGAGLMLAAGSAVLAGSVLSRHSRGDRERLRQPYRIFMLTQYGAHLALAPLAVPLLAG